MDIIGQFQQPSGFYTNARFDRTNQNAAMTATVFDKISETTTLLQK
jgi:hypothetical protein